MGKHLIFVGGGHAHLTALARLGEYVQANHKVTLITPSAYQYYSGMGPGMLSGFYRPQEVRFHVKKLAERRGATFVPDEVVKVDADRRVLSLKSGEEMAYDVISFNTGSEVPAPHFVSTSGKDIFPVKPIVNLLRARRLILNARAENPQTHLVVGGGAAGVEITANLSELLSRSSLAGRVILIAGERLLRAYPEKVRDLAMRSLQAKEVEVIEGNHLKEVRKETAFLEDGRTLDFDLAFLATGIRPSPLFEKSGLPVGKDGGLLVNAYLQCVSFPDIFGGGDCISFAGSSLPKVGVYAVRQNPILFQNLMAALEGSPMRTFVPQKNFLAILNMGRGKGILWWKDWVWSGRLSFLLKNYIDKTFMKKFQISGELEEDE